MLYIIIIVAVIALCISVLFALAIGRAFNQGSQDFEWERSETKPNSTEPRQPSSH